MSYKVVAIIPARKGSKRLPGKNKRLLCGKPLIIYTLEQATECNFIDKIIISTDDQDIIDICDIFRQKHFFSSIGYNSPRAFEICRRPDFLAQDDSSIDNVVRCELREYSDSTIVILLQPTSPLREKGDIKACYNIYKISNNATIIPVFREDEYHFKLNGSIFIFNLGLLRKRGSILNNYFFMIYNMPKERSIDIDTLEDFQEAERLMKKRLEK